MSNHTKASVDWFMAKISRFERAYRKANFAFIVHLTPGGAEIINAQLALVPVLHELPPKSVKIGNFLAQRYDLLKSRITVKELLHGLMNRKLLVPSQQASFRSQCFSDHHRKRRRWSSIISMACRYRATT